MPVVATLFFSSGSLNHPPWQIEEWRCPDFLARRRLNPSEWMGLPLWKPRIGKHSHQAVYSWAIDMCAAGETRWVVVGPFDSVEEARSRITGTFNNNPVFAGYRIENEHCWVFVQNHRICATKIGIEKDQLKLYPMVSYTDG